MNQRGSPAAAPAMTHAVFIDGDWLSVGIQQARVPFDYGQLLEFLEAEFGASAIHMYLSVSAKRRQVPGLVEGLTALGITVHAIPLMPHGKSNIDICLALDATALPPEISTFVLLSGDSDFVPLLTRMRQAGRRTVLISFPLMLSTLLRDAADDFINLENVLAAQSRRKSALSAPSYAPLEVSHRPPSQVIFEKGEHLRPYLFVRKLLTAARKDVVVIDPYVGVELFETLACLQRKVKVSVITDERKVPKDLGALVARCRRDGLQLRVFTSTDIHDRYLRIDDDWWHSGHSFKDLGSRVSQLNRVDGINRDTMRQIEQRTLASARELHPQP